MRKLSKSVDEYLAAGGWSSSLFFEHAKALFNDPVLKRCCTFEVGRSVIYIRSGGKLLKVYVHYKGLSREYITFVSEDGDDLRNHVHCNALTRDIRQVILEYFQRA